MSTYFTNLVNGTPEQVKEADREISKDPLLHAIMRNTIGQEGFKDAGIETAWLTPLPWYAELTGGVVAPSPDVPVACEHEVVAVAA